MAFQTILFYQYVTIPDPAALRDTLFHRAHALDLRGRILIAEEGINGTVEGAPAAITRFIELLHSYPFFATMSIKTSDTDGTTFPKLSVRVRKEIVGTQFPVHIDPRTKTAPRIDPQTLHEWYRTNKDFTIIDMRNDYEFASGHFRGSVNPGLDNSRDLPQAMDRLTPYKDKTVLTVCTGGVRCEKMSAYLLDAGFNEVYQLEDGMHGYMQQYPGQDFLGTLYTFDQRVTMDFGGDREVIGRCRRCDATTEQYINCAYDPCHLHFLICTDCQTKNIAHCSEACAMAADQ